MRTSGTRWKKSSRSGAGNCVEVADTGDSVHVRDSKAVAAAGPVLSFTRREWEAFIEGVKSGEFD